MNGDKVGDGLSEEAEYFALWIIKHARKDLRHFLQVGRAVHPPTQTHSEVRRGEIQRGGL